MEIWHNFFQGHTAATGIALTGSYNLPLVLLSVFIACLASFAALSIVQRMIATEGQPNRKPWLLAGASAMGCGIWAMHFTGMLAFSLPIPVRYDVNVTLLSLIPAILGSGAALHCLAQRRLGGWRLQVGSLLMAVGIGTMHYGGMAGTKIQGVMQHSFGLFLLSLLVAHGLAMAAIYIRFTMKTRFALPDFWVKGVSAVVMGSAVAGMHYTAMASARFYPSIEPLDLAGTFSNITMGATIVGLSLVVLVLALGAARVDRRIEESEQRRQSVEARANTILNTTADGILALDAQGRVLTCNPAAEAIFGLPYHQLLSRSIHTLVPDLDLRECPTLEAAATQDKGRVLHEARGLRADGSIFPLEVTLNALVEGDAEIIVISLRDMTERQKAREAMEYMAFYDSLTGLPNRILLKDRLQHALVDCERRGDRGSLLFIDLDGFKTLNDTYGHDSGDRLLQLVAARLQEHARRGDTVARLGGDEFVMVLENLGEDPAMAAEHARAAAERLIETFNQPYQLGTHEHFGAASIGLTLFGPERTSVEDLLKQADIAMYQAKTEGGGTLRFFDPEMQARIQARVDLEMQLRRALQQDEFVLHLQPQVDGRGEILGAEALLRWQHPERGLVPPLDFIPLCEETGLIHPLGYWVLDRVCGLLAEWSTQPSLADLQVAVNVSAQQFRHPDFVDRVIDLIEKHGANPRRLTLELTESVLVAHMEDTVSRMAKLKRAGVGFSLDDFGTGYSSLTYLKRLPLDQIKIDKSFVQDVLTDSNGAALAQMIIELARLLGLSAVAEGVETREQRDFLTNQGCRAFQGFLFARPLEVSAFEHYARKTEQRPHLELVKG